MLSVSNGTRNIEPVDSTPNSVSKCLFVTSDNESKTNCLSFDIEDDESKTNCLSFDIEDDEFPNSSLSRIKKYLKPHIQKDKYPLLQKQSPDTLVNYFETFITHELLREHELTPQKIRLTEELGVNLEELRCDVNSSLKDVPVIGETYLSKNFLTPLKRKKSQTRKEVETFSGILKCVTRKELKRKFEEHEEQQKTYCFYIKSMELRTKQKEEELTEIHRLTRSQVNWMRSLVSTEELFNKFTTWMIQEKENLTKDALNLYFLKNIAPSFKNIRYENLEFYYRPHDINFTCMDKKGRSNLIRLQLGMNPFYFNSEGREASFEWHHLTFDQKFGSAIVLIKTESHTDELHPKYLLGWGLPLEDRDLFNLHYRSAVNKSLSKLL
jgi:hypothetical protein